MAEFYENSQNISIISKSDNESDGSGGKQHFRSRRKSMLTNNTVRRNVLTSTPKPKHMHMPSQQSQELQKSNIERLGSEDSETQSYDMEAALRNDRINQDSHTKEKNSVYSDTDIRSLIERQQEMEKRMSQLERENEELRKKVPKKKQKIEVRKSTRSFVRSSYANLEATENLKFEKTSGFFCEANKNLVSRIKEDIKGLDSAITDEEANEAIKTYYYSAISYEGKKKQNNFLFEARKKERMKLKLKKRKEALMAKNCPEVQKTKVMECMTLAFMSSEDEVEDSNSYIKRPLRWRSDKCDNVFEVLDMKASEMMSRSAKRQTSLRMMGEFSNRPLPGNLPASVTWAVIKK